jgi:hypothetical protein
MTDIAFEDWKLAARNRRIADVIAERLGHLQLKKSSEGYEGPCPLCGGTDRFSINARKNVWHCRQCNADKEKGAGVIGLIVAVEGVEFIEACTILNGCPPPGRNSKPVEPDREAAKERHDERLERRAEEKRQEVKREASILDYVLDIWNAGKPIVGTHAHAYLRNRGLDPSHDLLSDLRFVPELDYKGFKSPEATEQEVLGRFPAMIAAITNGKTEITGIHRTYLDPDSPIKLRAPGDRARNKSKKSFGHVRGSLIRLGSIRPSLAIAEGVETALAWYAIGQGPDDCSIAAGISLGNIGGKCTGTTMHPGYPERRVPNGEPSADDPGIDLPADVRSVILIGDGDSDAVTTRALLLAGARRLQRRGLEVSIQMAPAGTDFNDVLIEHGKAEAA